MTQVYNSQLDAFDLYHKIQEAPEKTQSILGGPVLPALGHAIAGSTGAAISNICTYPLALIITRLQIQRQLRKNATSPHSDEYHSIGDAVRKIYTREKGLDGFYVGLVSDTSKTIADSFLFFLAYNFLRQSRMRSSRSSSKQLPVLEELSVGFLAGATSKFLTTPIANIVTRKQTSSMLTARSPGEDISRSSVRSIALHIKSEKGLQGFWSGYSASLVLTMNPSLTFFFFESLKPLLLSREQRSQPSTQATFFLAAFSKGLASSITYPFSLAKSRLQASSTKEYDSSTVKLGSQQAQRVPSNVFSVIIQIVQYEGIGALYEGLGGEILKGFFSHGITMIVKEAVHKFVIRLYYTLLKLLRQYPTPQDLAIPAKKQAEQVVGSLGEKTQQAVSFTKDSVRSAAAKGQDLVEQARETASDKMGD